jgi:hypothetical protein
MKTILLPLFVLSTLIFAGMAGHLYSVSAGLASDKVAITEGYYDIKRIADRQSAVAEILRKQAAALGCVEDNVIYAFGRTRPCGSNGIDGLSTCTRSSNGGKWSECNRPSELCVDTSLPSKTRSRRR